MRYSWLLILFAFLCCSRHCVFAQLRTDTLRTVEKKATRTGGQLPALQKADFGIKTLTADKATLEDYRNSNVASLLSQQFPVFLRTYGTNGLATLSLRGASAAQTAVRWNDVPLQNGATGVVDLFIIPVAVVDDVSLEFGNAGARYGSGAVGGTLALNNTSPAFKPERRWSVYGAYGSFGRILGAVNAQQSGRRWSGGLSAIAQRSENDFSYTDQNGNAARMTNGRYSSGSVQGRLAYKISDRQTLSAIVWADHHEREIPPALFEAYSVKEQRESAIRSLLRYDNRTRRSVFSVTASMFDEWFRYNDSAIGLQTRIHTRQWFLNPVFTRLLDGGRHQLSLSFPQQLNAFVGDPDKHILKSAIVGTGQFRFGRLALAGSARTESINGKVLGAADANGAVHFRRLTVRGGGGYAYRAPTLNEWYYQPGGNPDLLPEQGVSAEAGYDWQPLREKEHPVSFTHSSTVFYRNMRNWILWLGGAIWTPHNIARVESRGFETENTLRWQRRRIAWQLRLNASFISARTLESRLPNDGSIGRQIPYAPQVLAQGTVGFHTRTWRLHYNQAFIGVRYYNSDETGILPAFSTGNVQAGYKWQRQRWTADLTLQLQNIWAARYTEVSGRPAPGRNWLAGLSLQHQR